MNPSLFALLLACGTATKTDPPPRAQHVGAFGTMAVAADTHGCTDRQANGTFAGGFYIEDGHSGQYTVCNAPTVPVWIVGHMTLPKSLPLQQKLDDDAAASVDMGPGAWTEGTTLSGRAAREERRASPGLEGDNAVRRARFVLHEGKLYIAAIISEDPDSAEATALLDSVVFNDLSPAK